MTLVKYEVHCNGTVTVWEKVTLENKYFDCHSFWNVWRAFINIRVTERTGLLYKGFISSRFYFVPKWHDQPSPFKQVELRHTSLITPSIIRTWQNSLCHVLFNFCSSTWSRMCERKWNANWRSAFYLSKGHRRKVAVFAISSNTQK